ncbi:hypothetical protein CMQ_4732 [Grosmannia clavigera kw1407]|uniref:RNA-binding protein n=1 Tax=Grosmannia clavigera (strain kw1407 / UAMH 11150) TaxID=655863 RepID=F0XUQ1_GROCL|nr:uncharacterized protein CMQ_4732 [Grosmannia clavigera kw1407]EFW98880.1 hypothetical protein CMQ_4732 [Grosmannia clavigera kw1407]
MTSLGHDSVTIDRLHFETLVRRDDGAIQNEYQPPQEATDDTSAGSDWGPDSGGTRIPSATSFYDAPFKRRLPNENADTDFGSGYHYANAQNYIHGAGGNDGPPILRDRSHNMFNCFHGNNEAPNVDRSTVPRAQGQGHEQFGLAGVRGFGPVLERNCRRTIRVMNMPVGTAHAALVAVIRGGPVLDIYIRTHDHSAMISFLYPADATAFFDHVQKTGLYIEQKRVNVCWAERQFTLPGDVAHKIRNGATRNLVIRRCNPSVTEEMLREDLDHIHNIVILKVEFTKGSCYISTNSVHNALFARTCMISRSKFKGSKIEWYPDECAQPLESFHQNVQPSSKPKKVAVTTKKLAMPKVANRFQLLDLANGDDENSEYDDDNYGTSGAPNAEIALLTSL